MKSVQWFLFQQSSVYFAVAILNLLLKDCKTVKLVNKHSRHLFLLLVCVTTGLGFLHWINIFTSYRWRCKMQADDKKLWMEGTPTRRPNANGSLCCFLSLSFPPTLIISMMFLTHWAHTHCALQVYSSPIVSYRLFWSFKIIMHWTAHVIELFFLCCFLPFPCHVGVFLRTLTRTYVCVCVHVHWYMWVCVSVCRESGKEPPADGEAAAAAGERPGDFLLPWWPQWHVLH